MAHEFRMTRRVQFAETDMAGIVHFSQFFRYMEETEHAFYRSLGLSVHVETDDGFIGWPRIAASCDYRQPLKFEDEVEIHLLVETKQSRTISYRFTFRRADAADAAPIARGAMTVACAEKTSDAALRGIDIPETINAAIEAAPEPKRAWRRQAGLTTAFRHAPLVSDHRESS